MQKQIFKQWDQDAGITEMDQAKFIDVVPPSRKSRFTFSLNG